MGQLHVGARAIRLTTSRDSQRLDRQHKGGAATYQKLKRELGRLASLHSRPTAWFSTMFDLYRLPNDYPGWHEAQHLRGLSKAVALEKAMEVEVDHRRFIPYIQLHEFEALLLADIGRFSAYFVEKRHETAIAALAADVAQAGDPEDINDRPQTAPSKRIIRWHPGYGRGKLGAATAITEAIALPKMRERCPHFDQWVTRLEQLGKTA